MSGLTRPVLFSTDPKTLQDVSPGLQMGVTLGEHFSVAVMRFLHLGSDKANVAAKPHSHGEETSLVLKGGATIQLAGEDVVAKEGDILVVGPDVPHGGFNHFPPSGECVRLNVVTPPRPEYVAAGGKPYYPVGASSRPASAPAVKGERIRRMTMLEDSMDEIVPGSLYRKHLYGESVSVAVLKSVDKGSGPKSTNTQGHHHGEEVLYMIRGGCVLDIEGELYEIPEGHGIITPAGARHGGGQTHFEFNGGECIRVAITTPARRDYGPDLTQRIPAT